MYMKYMYCHDTPLGNMLLTGDGENLTGLSFDSQKNLAGSLKDTYEEKKIPVFCQTIEWLDIYFNGKNPDFMPSIKLAGTPFRMAVWKKLQQIPYGKTVTYGQIAKEIAAEKGIARMSAQAVGGAVGHNPVAILVPCHRVMGVDGSLTGYAGGIERKEELLAYEGFNKR